MVEKPVQTKQIMYMRHKLETLVYCSIFFFSVFWHRPYRRLMNLCICFQECRVGSDPTIFRKLHSAILLTTVSTDFSTRHSLLNKMYLQHLSYHLILRFLSFRQNGYTPLRHFSQNPFLFYSSNTNLTIISSGKKCSFPYSSNCLSA